MCIALSEIMKNTTRDMVVMYSESLVPTVRTALADSLPEVPPLFFTPIRTRTPSSSTHLSRPVHR